MEKKQICNKCGRELDMWDRQEDFTIKKHLGYGTIYDGDRLELKLCCKCLEELVEECKVSPIETENNE